MEEETFSLIFLLIALILLNRGKAHCGIERARRDIQLNASKEFINSSNSMNTN